MPQTTTRPVNHFTAEEREWTVVTEKEQQANKTVKNYMWWSVGASLIPVPYLDLVAVSGVQLKMLADISKVYGVEFHEERGKAIVAALLGSIVPSALSFGPMASVLKAVPLVGPLVGLPSLAAFCAGSTYALGKVFIQHFECGGTLLTFDPAKVKEYFQRAYAGARSAVADMRTEKQAEAIG